MTLKGKKVIALVSEDFEDLELWYPVLRLREAGASVHLVAEKKRRKSIMANTGFLLLLIMILILFAQKIMMGF